MANTYVQNYLHIIFHTKSKTTDILSDDLPRVHKYLGGIVRNQGGKLIEVGGMTDHVHMLVSLPKTVALADFMRIIKAESSRWLKTVNAHYYGAFSWQEGYGAFSVSSSVLPKVVEYIRNQQEHHKVRTFIDEYKEFLKAYEIDYDERYL